MALWAQARWSVSREAIKTIIRVRVEMFLGEANATEGLGDPDSATVDGVTHAVWVAADGDVDKATTDAICLAALAFEYGKKAGARSTRTP